jgi:hypothetical protein
MSQKSDTTIFNVHESLYYLEDGGRKFVPNTISICQDPQNYFLKFCFLCVDAKNANRAVDVFLHSCLTSALDLLNGQLHDLATLTPSKERRLSFDHEGRWAPELVWSFGPKENSLASARSEPPFLLLPSL